MRVFKTTYKDRKGHTKEASAWYVEIRDQLDTVRRLPAFQSKAALEEMGRNLESWSPITRRAVVSAINR